MVTKRSAWDMVKNRGETWKQIKWTWLPESNREAGDSVVRNFLLHWFPAKVTRQSISWKLLVLAGHHLGSSVPDPDRHRHSADVSVCAFGRACISVS